MLDCGRFETAWRGAGPAAEWALCGSAYGKHIPTARARATFIVDGAADADLAQDPAPDDRTRKVDGSRIAP